MLSVLQFTGNQDVSFGPLFINKLKTGMAEYWILDYLLPNLFGLVSTKKHSLSFVKHIPSPAHLLLAYRQTECCWLERAGSSCCAHEGCERGPQLPPDRPGFPLHTTSSQLICSPLPILTLFAKLCLFEGFGKARQENPRKSLPQTTQSTVHVCAKHSYPSAPEGACFRITPVPPATKSMDA